MEQKMQTHYINTESIPVDKVVSCKYCKNPITWLTSKKTGSNYPVNCPNYDPIGYESETVIIRNDIHKCPEREAWLAKNG